MVFVIFDCFIWFKNGWDIFIVFVFNVKYFIVLSGVCKLLLVKIFNWFWNLVFLSKDFMVDCFYWDK